MGQPRRREKAASERDRKGVGGPQAKERRGAGKGKLRRPRRTPRSHHQEVHSELPLPTQGWPKVTRLIIERPARHRTMQKGHRVAPWGQSPIGSPSATSPHRCPPQGACEETAGPAVPPWYQVDTSDPLLGISPQAPSPASSGPRKVLPPWSWDKPRAS